MNLLPLLMITSVLGAVIGLKDSIGMADIGVITEADRVVLTPKKYIFYNLNFQIQNMRINDSILKDHPCFDNSSVELIRLIVTEGKDFEELLTTLPSEAGISTTEKCQSSPEECVQEIIRGSRAKRSWGESLVVGLSSAFFTFVSNRDLTSKIDKLRENLNVNTESDKKWRMDSQATLESMRRYSIITSDALKNETCRNQVRFALTEYLFQIQSYYTRMRDVIVMSLNNQVSRDLISVVDLYNTILIKPEMRGTIYRMNPHLFYVLSNVFIYYYDKKSITVHFTLTVPQIDKDDVSMMYKVYNYGWLDNGIRYQYDIPSEYFSIKDISNSLIVEASKTLCRTVGTLYLCDTGSYIHSHRSACIQSILENQTDSFSCELLVSRIEIIDQVIPIRSGILVYGRKVVESGILIKGHPNIQFKRKQNDSSIYFYKYQKNHFIKVDNTYYKEKANAEDIKLISQAPTYHSKREIDFGVLGSEFAEDTLKHIEIKIEKLKDQSLEYYRSAYLPSPGKVDLISMVFIGIVLILSAIIGALILYIRVCEGFNSKKRKPVITRSQREEQMNLGSFL